jgi:hypothetical protein
VERQVRRSRNLRSRLDLEIFTSTRLIPQSVGCYGLPSVLCGAVYLHVALMPQGGEGSFEYALCCARVITSSRRCLRAKVGQQECGCEEKYE